MTDFSQLDFVEKSLNGQMRDLEKAMRKAANESYFGDGPVISLASLIDEEVIEESLLTYKEWSKTWDYPR